MLFRTVGAIATLLIGLGVSGGDALAQHYPLAQPYPPPQAYPPPQGYPPYRPLPPLADAQDDQFEQRQRQRRGGRQDQLETGRQDRICGGRAGRTRAASAVCAGMNSAGAACPRIWLG